MNAHKLQQAIKPYNQRHNMSLIQSFDKLLEKTIKWLQSNQNAESVQKMTRQIMNQLNRKTNIHNPAEVRQTIIEATNEFTGKPLNPQSKRKWQLIYKYFCQANKINGYEPIKFKCSEDIPIIPTKSQVERIIAATNRDYKLIFTIMTETGAEGEELHRTTRYMIDTEQRVITIKGVKGHGTANYRLKQTTNQMLIEYLAKHQEDLPFPKAKLMGQAWRHARDKLAKAEQTPDLKKIPLKNLRNYSGAQLYLSMSKPDPISVMRHLRHKKIERTMHYIRAIVIPTEEDIEYHSTAVKTKEEALEACNKNYTYQNTTPDGWMIYRKRK